MVAMQVTVHNIVHALTAARVDAESMAEQYPEYRTVLLRFAEDASRAQRQLLKKIRPELLGSEKAI
jgi:hypothetical protein